MYLANESDDNIAYEELIDKELPFGMAKTNLFGYIVSDVVLK